MASSAKGTFSALLCKLRPSAAPLLDGSFCTSSLTGRDLKRACDSLKRLLVAAVDVQDVEKVTDSSPCVHSHLTREVWS